MKETLLQFQIDICEGNIDGCHKWVRIFNEYLDLNFVDYLNVNYIYVRVERTLYVP